MKNQNYYTINKKFNDPKHIYNIKLLLVLEKNLVILLFGITKLISDFLNLGSNSNLIEHKLSSFIIFGI